MTAKLDGTNGLLQQYDYQAPTTGFSYTFAAGTTVLILQPAGTLATGTITMPAAPADGMTISFSSTQIITALTVSPNTGQSIVGNPTTLLAGGAATFVYRLSNTTWYAQVNTAAVGAVVTAGATGVNTVTVGTSPGTYTKPASVKSIKVTVVAGGGTTTTSPTLNRSLSGGGGGAAIRYYPAASLPGPQPYTVGGAGASSSFGVAPITVISATAGGAGTAHNGTTPLLGAAGGAGSNGELNIPGGQGGPFCASNVQGPGGNSLLGQGGAGNISGVGGAGNVYGGGGGGSNNPTTGTAAGGQGVVIIEEVY